MTTPILTTSPRRRWKRSSFPAAPPTKVVYTLHFTQLAEQDPLINLRQDDTRREISVSLYGEVQKEVIQATLANDFDIDVTFPRDNDSLHRTSGRYRYSR